MRILWASNSPLISSGYGVQTALFTRLMEREGWEVFVFAFFGHFGKALKSGKLTILPASLDAHGRDAMRAHADRLKCDANVLLYDIWAYEPDEIAPYAVWCPVDHDPITPHIEARLTYPRALWAMSRHGERMMRAAGADPYYVPHAVRTSAYTPVDREVSRGKFKIKPDQFLVSVVAANKGFPSRKSLDRILKAWGRFVKSHPNGLLYLHTTAIRGEHNGLDLPAVMKFYDCPSDTVRFPQPHAMLTGACDSAYMNTLYNASDVLLSPSAGEGFGVPVLEAQASGCPAIVSDFTAQSELVGPGYLIPIGDDDRSYTQYGSEQAAPPVSQILAGLEWAYEQRGDTRLRQQATAFARDYQDVLVWSRYMRPALIDLAERFRYG